MKPTERCGHIVAVGAGLDYMGFELEILESTTGTMQKEVVAITALVSKWQSGETVDQAGSAKYREDKDFDVY